MSRRKKRYDLPFWVTGPSHGKNSKGSLLPFVQLSADLLQAPAFCTLSPCTRLCYIAMCCEAKGRPDFKFPRAAAERYGISPRSLLRCVDELIAAGFIHCKSAGRITRTPNEYAFTFDWKCRPDT